MENASINEGFTWIYGALRHDSSSALTRWMTSLDGTHISSQSFAPAWRAAPTDDPPTSAPRHAPCAPPGHGVSVSIFDKAKLGYQLH